MNESGVIEERRGITLSEVGPPTRGTWTYSGSTVR